MPLWSASPNDRLPFAQPSAVRANLQPPPPPAAKAPTPIKAVEVGAVAVGADSQPDVLFRPPAAEVQGNRITVVLPNSGFGSPLMRRCDHVESLAGASRPGSLGGAEWDDGAETREGLDLGSYLATAPREVQNRRDWL